MAQPFQYQPFVNPYAASIGETLAHQNDAQAHAAEVIGAAQAHAQEVTGQAYGGAVAGIGQSVGGAIDQATDPKRQLVAQQVAANKRDVAYQATANGIAKSLVGPNGEQPTPEAAGAMMTKAGIPVSAQKAILDSLQSGSDHADEARAEAGHIAYQVIKHLPPGASADDQAHAASAALGASIAGGMVSPGDAAQVTNALANGANPLGMALGFMGKSPSGKFKDVIQDETKPVVLAGAPRPGATPATLVSPSGSTLATGAPAGPERPPTPTEASLAADAATLGTPNETSTAAQSATALKSLKPAKDSSAEMDAQAQALLTKQNLGQTLTPEEAASLKAYQQRRTIPTDAAAAAAADRQARTQAEQNALQKRSQDFQESQAGRKELTEKVEQPLQTALGSAQTLRDVVSAAQQGNKVAASLQSLETTMSAIKAQGLNRINSAEIGATANAGSLYDTIVGRLGKLVAGEPVPPDLQKDMTDFAGILEKAAYKKYSDAWDSTVPRYKLGDEKKLAPPGAPPEGTQGNVGGKPAVWTYIGGKWGWAPK